LLLAAAAIVLVIFRQVEAKASDPVLHPDLLGSRELKLIAAIALATGFTEAAMVFLPSMAVTAFAVTDATASFMLLPLVATLIVGAPAAGRLVDAIGAKAVIQGGLVFCVAGLVGFGVLDLTLPWFFTAGALTGFGLAVLLGAPLRYVVIREVAEDQRGAGQGLLTLFLSIGQLAGAALVGGVTTARAGQLGGYQEAFLWIAAGMSAVGVLSVALKRGAGHAPARRASKLS
jgi:MFS family permease